MAQGYDLGDFAFLSTGDGVVAIDAGTAPHRVRAAMSDAGVQDSQVSHVILTHSHFDHAGMLEALRFIIDLGPRTLIHGHILLTEVFTMETVTGLLPALSELREQALAGLGADLTLTALLDSNILPDVLRENPAAVGPYLAIRDHFVQRLHRQHTGYWQSDGQGLDPVAPAERAAAFDLLAEGRPERFAEAARALLAQRDHALALEIATAGMARHPGAGELAELRQQALYHLMERHQFQDPFRFNVYAQLAGVELGPVA